jgi:hypothetical protein
MEKSYVLERNQTTIRLKIADEILDRFVLLFEIARDTQFTIGDLLEEVIQAHSPLFSKQQIVNYIAGHLRVSPGTLYDYHRIAMLWTPDWRAQYQNLDWTFYRMIDPTDPDDIELLETAIDEGWNVTTLKEEKYPILKSADSLLGRIISLCRKAIEATDIDEFDRNAIVKFLDEIETTETGVNNE